MKNLLKKSIYAMFVAVTAISAFIFTSCEKTDPREVYVGSYRTNYEFTYNGQKFSGTYTLTIVKSSTNDNDIILNNIDDSKESVRATVSGNAFTIPQQTIADIGISGSGTLSGNTLSFSTMETSTGGSSINVTQTATKQ